MSYGYEDSGGQIPAGRLVFERCQACGQLLATSDGCPEDPYPTASRWGHEPFWEAEDLVPLPRCPDCWAGHGQPHHAACLRAFCEEHGDAIYACPDTDADDAELRCHPCTRPQGLLRRRMDQSNRPVPSMVPRSHASCSLCGGPINYAAPSNARAALTVDHHVPLWAGGHPLDWRPAHRSCNSSRGAREGNRLRARRRVPANFSRYW